MKKILCTLPNASTLIGGIEFKEHPKGVVSVKPVDDATAERFGKIPGYELIPVGDSGAGKGNEGGAAGSPPAKKAGGKSKGGSKSKETEKPSSPGDDKGQEGGEGGDDNPAGGEGGEGDQGGENAQNDDPAGDANKTDNDSEKTAQSEEF